MSFAILLDVEMILSTSFLVHLVSQRAYANMNISPARASIGQSIITC